jgi:hypothetical protein
MVPKFPSGADVATHRDPAPARKPVNSAVFAKSREISVRVRGLRGLELRAKHAVAIEPVSGE